MCSVVRRPLRNGVFSGCRLKYVQCMGILVGGPLSRIARQVASFTLKIAPFFSILTWLRGQSWSWRRFLQGEALPSHFGWADPYEYPKCGYLGSVIVSRDCVRAVPNNLVDIHTSVLFWLVVSSPSQIRRCWNSIWDCTEYCYAW